MPMLVASASAARLRLQLGRPVILLVSLVSQGFGGLETHVLSLYRQLALRGHAPLLLVAANSPLHNRIRKEEISFYAVRGTRLRGFRHIIPWIFSRLLRRHDIRAIHCNNRFEVPGALQVGSRFSSRVVFNYHVPDKFDTSILRGLRVFVSPAIEVVQYLEAENRAKNLGIQRLLAIPPLFDDRKFLVYRSSLEPVQWFAKTFGISMNSSPIICSIGNMVPDLEHKNYPLLFAAISALIGRGTPVQAVLVGDGLARPYLEQLATRLGISGAIHFLGHQDEHVPGVLHHSAAFVLASKREAFGIAYLEAGLMRRPAIGARQTGAEKVIVDGETGLLFNNGDADDLACAIGSLIGSPEMALRLGERAFGHVTRTYSPSIVVQQYEALYS